MKLKHISVVLAVALALGMAPGAWGAARYKVIHSFGSGKDGAVPWGPLIFDSRGNLYGVTGGGGTGQCSDYGCGTVFELEKKTDGTWKESILYNFTAGDAGAFPYGVLVFNSAGDDLYGTVQGYGSFAVSGVFELKSAHERDNWAYSMLYKNEGGPGLLIDHAGNLYGELGAGEYGAGAIAELSREAGGWTYTGLYSFYFPEGLGTLPAAPIRDGKGNMFGITADGGIGRPTCWTSLGCGVVFEMTPNKSGTWNYHVLHRFLEFFLGDGQTPNGGVVVDASGNVYGTTEYGGAHGNGTVFELSPVSHGWQFTILYDFPECNIGCVPVGNLVLDESGNVYGVNSGGLTECGYDYDCGVIFKLSPQKNGKWKYGVLHKFTGKDGNFPNYGMTMDDKGNLFGVTTAGGKYYEGVAFELKP